VTEIAIPAHVKRFANLVNRPGGQTAEEAIGAASANLETIRDRVVAAIDTTVQQMQALGVLLHAGSDPAAVEEMYKLANTVVGLAGTAGLGSLGDVSYSLCELIDRLRMARIWNIQAIQLHLDALRRLQNTAPGEQAAAQAVTDALRRVVARIPMPPAT
jgi:chemotaxis protein histidine kinase CheA